MTEPNLSVLEHLLATDPTISVEVATEANPEKWKAVKLLRGTCRHTATQLCAHCLRKRLETHHVRILAQDGAPVWTDPTHPDVKADPR